MDLFSHRATEVPLAHTPLAERLRPESEADFFGHNRGQGAWRMVERALRQGSMVPNMVFWGPPGTGKTTLARLLAQKVDATFIPVNAIDSGAKELRQIGEEARARKLMEGRATLLFVDEIHRLNKGQQDVLLPFSERGDFVLVGATTENPSYELNSALLSRCQVLRFERLLPEDLRRVLDRAFDVLGESAEALLREDAISELVAMSDGDARRLLTTLDLILRLRDGLSLPLDQAALRSLELQVALGYQRSGEDHYDCISAFIKSIRGSDPDAGIYYLARMLEGGEDPVFIARRLVILASEDIGNADPRAVTLAVSCLQAVELVGMPEAAISLAQAVTYLASAPKSNASYMAIKKAQEYVKTTGRAEIPMALRSSRTRLNREMGYGRDYAYSHEGPKGYIPQDFLPEVAKGEKFYQPKELGFEKTIRQYLAWLREEKDGP